jgi:hypothetical protein
VDEATGDVHLADGETVKLYVKVRETMAGASITSLVWSAVDGTLDGQVDASDKTDSTINWTAPNPAVAVENVVVTATDSQGATASYTFVFKAAAKCLADHSTDGHACNDGNPCTENDVCNGATCAGTAKVCVASDECHAAGVCNTTTGICSNPLADGKVCNDGNACTQTDTCAGGTCHGSDPVVCSALDTCHVAGTCDTGTGVCSNPTGNDGNTCTPATPDVCVTGTTCLAGACQGGHSALDCTHPGQCQQGGACANVGGVATCVYDNKTNDMPCNADSSVCTPNDSCQAGVCVADSAHLITSCPASDACHTAGMCDATAGCGNDALLTCSAGEACSLAQGGICAPIPAPAYALSYGVASLSGVAVDGAGNQYVAASMFGTGYHSTVAFGGLNLTALGGADALVAKLDPTTGAATWASVFGGDLVNDDISSKSSNQYVYGVAVSKSGYVGVVGKYDGHLLVNGTTTLSAPGGFIMGLTAAGAGNWGVSVNVQNGQFTSIAGNPNQDDFVVCGYVKGAVTDLGIAAPGTYGGDNDILIAKINAADGTVRWAKQLGGAGSQTCTSVALADDGSVYATGTVLNGSLGFGTGGASVYGVATQAVFVAKFATDGTAGASQTYGTDGFKNSANRIAVDASSNVAIVGTLNSDLTIKTSMTWAGGSDAFAAKFDSNLVPQWNKSWGDADNDQDAKGVAFDSAGDVFVVGYLYGTATGLGSPAIAASGDSDMYWAKLTAGRGEFLAGSNYGESAADALAGNTSGQSATYVAVANRATGAQKDKIAIAGYSSAGTIVFGGSVPNLTLAKTLSFIVDLNP